MLALLDLDETLIDRRSAFALWARRFVDAHDLGETEWTWLHDLDSTCRPRETFFAKVYARYGVGGSSTVSGMTTAIRYPDWLSRSTG